MICTCIACVPCFLTAASPSQLTTLMQRKAQPTNRLDATKSKSKCTLHALIRGCVIPSFAFVKGCQFSNTNSSLVGICGAKHNEARLVSCFPTLFLSVLSQIFWRRGWPGSFRILEARFLPASASCFFFVLLLGCGGNLTRLWLCLCALLFKLLLRQWFHGAKPWHSGSKLQAKLVDVSTGVVGFFLL